ncbi:MAG: prolyl-tRNA synthetase [Candidatus Kerfeldbacteria bacterium]|nr:prolyl-tRNA synthetase [Candidatus Kerfeldbacteria bacterium]
MRQSQLFTKTRKEAPKDEVAISAQLLTRAGFVHKDLAGAYTYLPLGQRVLDKIVSVIREEMVAIGGQEVTLSILQDPELWKKTDRWDDARLDVWFKSKLKNDQDVGLATTNEESIAAMMTDHIDSYRDLPRYVFQIQKKFRNELRARSGLLRAREFLMKDLYSFSKNDAELDIFYEQAKDAYHEIFRRVGLDDDTFLTFASGGTFSKYSHEFQTVCPAGEDTIYLSRAKNIAINKEVYTDQVLTELGLKKSELEEVSAIEVGNIFKLGTKYSEPLGLTFLDEQGKRRPVVMGSYGIGPGRVMATVVEKFHDEHGMIWPESIAPFRVHLLALKMDDREVKSQADELSATLQQKGIETLYDDRDVSAGTKFAEADLIGIPWRVVVSAKTLTKKKVEVKHRMTGQTEDLTPAAWLKRLSA